MITKYCVKAHFESWMLYVSYALSGTFNYIFVKHDLLGGIIHFTSSILIMSIIVNVVIALVAKVPLFVKKTDTPYQLYGYWYKDQISAKYVKLLLDHKYRLKEMNKYDLIELQLFNQTLFLDISHLIKITQDFFKDDKISVDDWMDLEKRVMLQKRFLNSISFLNKINLINKELVYFDIDNNEQKMLGTL